jgi:hypothetical protein
MNEKLSSIDSALFCDKRVGYGVNHIFHNFRHTTIINFLNMLRPVIEIIMNLDKLLYI